MKIKIKLLTLASIAALGTVAGISGSQTKEKSAITMANVEALTRWEVTVEYDTCCVDDPNDICVPNYMGIIAGRPVSC